LTAGPSLSVHVRDFSEWSVYYLIVILHEDQSDEEFSSCSNNVDHGFSLEFTAAVRKGWSRFIIAPLIQETVEDPVQLVDLLFVRLSYHFFLSILFSIDNSFFLLTLSSKELLWSRDISRFT
jgi:hypothetical protein